MPAQPSPSIPPSSPWLSHHYPPPYLSQGMLRRQWEVDDGQKRGGNEGRRPNKEAEKSAASTCVLRPRYTLCSYFRMSEGKESVRKRTDMNRGGL